MVEAGVSRAVMEVSSHALALRRTHGIRFAAAVFTNLSRDHFDFHRDFDDYFATKRMLFDQIDRSKQCAVINVDDDHGRRLAAELGATAMTFGRGAGCDIHPVSGFAPALDGLRGVLATPAGALRVESPLVGEPNLYNWMGAVGASIAAGVPLAAIESGIRALASVRGRFESVPSPDGPAVLVDYAHKPDALEKLLHAVRSLAEGLRVILVIGCGGDRDKGKRPEMGAIAGRLADFSILTSDNPRSESPEAIVRAIETGIETVEGAKWETVVDRREAIARAIGAAGSDDVVVIAGKGHENYQVVGDRVIHFDDREEVETVLKNRSKSR
jgi:UDP-N-acetylmuramoyl-L-alanyl-D-glutamate--2,6-diaminopimelate ligase